MIEPGNKHVLVRDLNPQYLRRQDYLGGFTSPELAWIRRNIGAAGLEDFQNLLKGCVKLTYEELINLIDNNLLIGGTVYLINDYQSIYSSEELDINNHKITYGLTNHPSEIYKLIVIAATESYLFPQAYIISESNPYSIYWNVKYDVTKETLEDGVSTKGKIIYLQDENFNQASFDFKNILVKYSDGNYYYSFTNSLGNENSVNCYNNDILLADHIILTSSCNNNKFIGSNIRFNVPVNNFIGKLENVCISTDTIGLINDTIKQSIKYNNKYYIDYLDIETLTHLFYET